MTNGMAAFVAKLTYPEYWGIGVVAGSAPLVVAPPCGYIVGGIVGVVTAIGLVLLERMDGRDLDDQEETERRRRTAHFRKPIFA